MADFYFKIKTNHMILKDLKTQKELEIKGNFSTSRLLVGDFYNATSQLATLVNQHGFRKGLRRLLDRSHRVVIHPLDQSEGGLCSVEERVLLEVTHGGFRCILKKMVIHQGERLLSDIEIKEKLQSSPKRPKGH
ncbi:hypothetical protein Xmau_01381 [Xenorhabdus mauleonii]|uniref:Rod shape-determining protein MreB n=1 Tax=Xenorhabdus mauleonii TaxID=351675 RepID=A0A1I3KW35_9GAMM|nr:hypothetical protein [Xenorhabdus mauleonii]PHM45173.1 hypothetical protein Xmau_01381 [Xenorhabdus mauleonii]SFI76702.1 rod shape-determining protein MreB [Xenorhabdus mauleonii]